MRGFHADWFWVAVISNGVAGIWGLLLAVYRRRRDVPPWSALAFGVTRAWAILSMLIQVGAGFLLYNQGFRPPSIHMFYGFLILFVFTFAYIYRAQLDRRPFLYYGLLLLFVMGLGIRAMANAPG